MPSWCIPRKGTPGYESVMRIRKGDEIETPKQIMDRLERKTTGKSKKEKRTMTVSLEEKGEDNMESQTASIPMIEEPKAKTVLKKRAPKVETDEEKLVKLLAEYSRASMEVSNHKRGTKAYKEAVEKRDEIMSVINEMRRNKNAGEKKENKHRWIYYRLDDDENMKKAFPEFETFIDDYSAFAKELNTRRKTPILNVVMGFSTDPDDKHVRISWYRRMFSKFHHKTGLPVEPHYMKTYEVGKPIPKHPDVSFEEEESKPKKETPEQKRDELIEIYQSQADAEVPELSTLKGLTGKDWETQNKKIMEASRLRERARWILTNLKGYEWKKTVKKLTAKDKD